MLKTINYDLEAVDKSSESLKLHASFPNGKIGINITKNIDSAYALSLAYSPHVAAPCLEIAKDPLAVRKYTNLSNSVAIITNGTALLGLGDIGPLASIPVMEGKSALFKMLGGIDCFVQLIDDKDPVAMAAIIRKISLQFGAINLEDIAAPSCFELCELLEDMPIPVFHDDQHGTAIVVYAAVKNYFDLVGMPAHEPVKLVCMGAGACAIAALHMLLELGIKRENIWLFDSQGLVHQQRSDISNPKNRYKRDFAQKSSADLADAMLGAHIFIGASNGGSLDASFVKMMAHSPLILALASPTPEIMPDAVEAVRKDAIYCSGRSDFNNQVNNVLCFPFLFRVILDYNLTINHELRVATGKAIAMIARENPKYGKNHLIPKSFDPIVRYTMPSRIMENLNQHHNSYARQFIRRINRVMGDLLLNTNAHMTLDDNKFHGIKYAFDKITHYWHLPSVGTMKEIAKNFHINAERDILLMQHKDHMYLGVSRSNYDLAAKIAESTGLLVTLYDFSAIELRNNDIRAIYRKDSSAVYLKSDIDLDTALLASLLFVNASDVDLDTASSASIDFVNES